MPPKELMQALDKGVDKVFIAPYGGGEWKELEKLDTVSITLPNPTRDEIEDAQSLRIDFADVKMENRGRDILFAISDGERTTDPVSAVIDTEIVTDDNNRFTGFSFKIKVNGREMREAIKKIVWAYKHPKSRKTTYKTLRHDCAKRNGRI